MKTNGNNNKSMKTFLIVWAGQFISTIGSGLTGFALGIWLFEETGSVTLFAMNILAFTLPTLIVTPFAGALVDRFNRRIVMILSDTGAGISTLLVWLLLITGNLEIWHIYVLTALNASFTAFQWPAYSAATTQLVAKKNLGRASGMVQIGEAISQLASPAIAGGLYLAFGLSGVVLIDVVAFLIAVGTLLVIKIPNPRKSVESQESKGSIWKEIRLGFRFIRERKGLFNLLMYFAAINFMGGFLGPLITPMMLGFAKSNEVGLVFSIMGIGMLVGTLAMSVWGGPKNRVLGIIIPGFIQGVGIMAIAAREDLVLIAVCGFLVMIFMPILNGSSQALWQSKVPADLQGRVFSVRRLLAQFTSPIAILMAGPIVDNILQPMMDEGGSLSSSLGSVIGTGDGRGTALMFVIVGGMTIIVSVIALMNPTLRKVQYDLPDMIDDEEEEQIIKTTPEPEPNYT